MRISNTKIAQQKYSSVVFGCVEGGIVSEGVAQVFDDLGNPHSHCGV